MLTIIEYQNLEESVQESFSRQIGAILGTEYEFHRSSLDIKKEVMIERFYRKLAADGVRHQKNLYSILSETFKLMERKLYRIIMFPAFIVTWISGLSMTHYVGIDTWLLLKIFFVILISVYHFFCLKCLNDFKNDKNKFSTKFFRITNEVPAVILIFILILVVFQPF